ncbi:hypothetical protein [Hymenobacter sp. UYCo722]|uniref:hypothetical protein n=1 Tax=Hymenobacter sp. UYCo722 TaxID=3156335 RepID=UPI003395FEC4
MMKKFLLLALGWLTLSPAPAQTRPRPVCRPHPPMRRSRFDATRPPAAVALPTNTIAFYPLVELRALNLAYVRELSRRRQLRLPLPPSLQPVQYDSLLLPGTVLHNQRLVTVNGDLFHDHQQPHAELCGYRSDLMRYRNQPAQLAHAIWQAFDDSKKGHKEVQQDHQYAFVSVSCSDTYFVVRLDRKPTAPTKAEQQGYVQWQKQTIPIP